MSRKYMSPEAIEEKSMAIIEKEIKNLHCSFEERQIIKRVIHTTVDVDFGKSLIFHAKAIEIGLRAIKKGKTIVTDVHMVKSGIRAYDLKEFGNNILCFFDKDKKEPNPDNIPRAVLAMRKAGKSLNDSIVAIGNAPTALFELIDMVKSGDVKPALIIGMPVGFVGAAESKEELQQLDIPYITINGRRGGSTVAAAILNALIKIVKGYEQT
ncbi:MAG: precorrin-8X methylmutase [Candidatus Omnitrophica bacterium]|nr:precorrin-8X methylmutase [Candidatus Omnitrophota bacterium]